MCEMVGDLSVCVQGRCITTMCCLLVCVDMHVGVPLELLGTVWVETATCACVQMC